MKYKINGNKIVFQKSPDFNIYDICHCGQLFRYFENDESTKIIAKNQIANVFSEQDSIVIDCTSPTFFVDYFDLNTDYDEIKKSLNQNDFLQKALEFGNGIRILHQDFFETFLSFLISQNNNIKRIQGSLNKLAKDFGEKVGQDFLFPTPKALKGLDAKYFESIGTGYRAKYLSQFVNNYDEKLFENFKSMPTNSIREELMKFLGVGQKVADCIILFGLGKKDVFPVDTWIDKVASEHFGLSGASRADMAKKLVAHFGNLSGYAQQYLFYYKREITRKNQEKNYE